MVPRVKLLSIQLSLQRRQKLGQLVGREQLPRAGPAAALKAQELRRRQPWRCGALCSSGGAPLPRDATHLPDELRASNTSDHISSVSFRSESLAPRHHLLAGQRHRHLKQWSLGVCRVGVTNRRHFFDLDLRERAPLNTNEQPFTCCLQPLQRVLAAMSAVGQQAVQLRGGRPASRGRSSCRRVAPAATRAEQEQPALQAPALLGVAAAAALLLLPGAALAAVPKPTTYELKAPPRRSRRRRRPSRRRRRPSRRPRASRPSPRPN